MSKFNAGKASILALTAIFAVSAFLLGRSLTSSVFAVAPPPYKIICHHTPGNEVTHEFANEQAYNGHLGTPHNESTYDTDGPCESPTGTGTPAPTPFCDEEEEDCDPTPIATPTEEPTATPDNDVCDNIEGVQGGVPDGLHLDASGLNCVSFSPANPPENPSTPQVLGASTMAATGTFTENIYLAIMTLGGLLTFKGAQNFKKAFKKA